MSSRIFLMKIKLSSRSTIWASLHLNIQSKWMTPIVVNLPVFLQNGCCFIVVAIAVLLLTKIVETRWRVTNVCIILAQWKRFTRSFPVNGKLSERFRQKWITEESVGQGIGKGRIASLHPQRWELSIPCNEWPTNPPRKGFAECHRSAMWLGKLSSNSATLDGKYFREFINL